MSNECRGRQIEHPTEEYRQEIDGLRMVAVLSVVFFHFSIPGFGGGFVGVDIFFVISGFLIGGALWREYKTNQQISVSGFYLRRLRRLAPAYITMCALTLVLGWFILLPFEFREFGKSLISSLFYVSNILFYRQSGYFDSAAEDKVLLHTWSLSVEEQFYVILPVILVLIRRPQAVIFVFFVIFLISITSSFFYTTRNHAAAFFLIQFRIWELLVGVLLAIIGQERAFSWKGKPFFSWIGFLLILYGLTFTSPGVSFPGFAVVLPVAGTAFVIFNGKDNNAINRFLSSQFSRFFGLISYSLYLWHWPVLVLSVTYFGTYGKISEILSAFALILILSLLSWRFVEIPFRRQGVVGNRVLLSVSMISGALLLTAGAAIYVNNGYIARFPDRAQMFIRASQDFLQDWSRCQIQNSGPLDGIETCAFGPRDAQPEVIVWGDSHVRAMREGIDIAAHEAGVAGLIVWNAGCPPLFNITKTETAATREQDEKCSAINTQLQEGLDDLDHIKRILLVGRWSYYATGEGVGIDAHNKIELSRPFEEALSETVDELLRSFDVYVMRQVPEFPDYSSHTFAKSLAHGHAINDDALELNQQAWENRALSSDKVMLKLASKNRVHLIDAWSRICGDACYLLDEDVVYYFDNNHLTNTGALHIRDVFTRFMKGSHERTD